MTTPIMRRPRSIVGPIVLLVVAAVAIASMVQFAITFMGPPPFNPPVPIEQIAKALRTGEAARGPWGRFTIEQSAPAGFTGDPSPQRDAAVAWAMGVPATQIHGLYDRPHGPVRAEIRGDFVITWVAPEGTRIARSGPQPMLTRWHRITLAATLAVLVVLGIGAWLIARAISHPIRRLAKIARETRLGARTPIPQEGPREVRELAAAFDAMQGRILEQAEGRTTMLAAIAHDMGTPITRLAFWVEQLPDEARDRANADIDEIRAMLATVLRFARDERADARDRIELGSLIESLVDDMKAAGTPVDVESGPRVVLRGDSQSLRRLFANLIDNGVRYGKVAKVEWRTEPGWAEVSVEDRGPGFPPNPETLFAPFVRGEGSRNRATGGTGLGLAIVRSIAEAHGGGVTLGNCPDGGGCVRVRLPVETANN
jgi:signal transduction histidine kinase